MKGGRIALPIEYFSENQSGNYTEENGNIYQSRSQENCTDSLGPNLEVQNGAGCRRKQRSRQQRRSSKRRSQRQRQQRRGSKQRQQKSRRQRQQRRGSKQRSQKRRQQRRN